MSSDSKSQPKFSETDSKMTQATEIIPKSSANSKTPLSIAVGIIMMVMLGLALVFSIDSLIASNKLLYRLKTPQPGTNIELIMDQLGRKQWDTSQVEVMEHWGSRQDPAFRQDKKLFVFSVSSPPCRAMEVYTDTNNIIVFVTWQQL